MSDETEARRAVKGCLASDLLDKPARARWVGNCAPDGRRRGGGRDAIASMRCRGGKRKP